MPEPTSSGRPYYCSTPAETFERLSTDSATGLSAAEVARRLAEHGPNELTEKARATLLQKLLEQFKDFLVIVLIVASVVSAFVGEWIDALVIIAIVIVNATLGVIQEGKAEKALEALKKMAAPGARVLRDSQVAHVPAASLVPGDVVLVEAGDIVPADLRLYESSSLKAEEASLTGESVPVDKTFAKTFDGEVPLGDRSNLLYMSTVVTYGRGRGVVVGTAGTTEIGRIADRLQNMEEEATPLQKSLNQLGKWLGILCLAVCAVVFLVGLLEKGEPLPLFLTAVSLAVAAIPEGLPAVVTIVLALGMKRMVDRHAIMKRLLAVETLGCVDTICSDKTGTLTQNEMTVTRIYGDGTLFAVSGQGYSPAGTVEPQSGSAGIASPVLDRLLHAALLCNDAILREKEEGGWGIVGDPTEGALVVAAAKGGIEPETGRRDHRRVAEIPFDSDRKRMTTFHNGFEPKHILSLTKGAPDLMVSRCTRIMTADGETALDAAGREAILGVNHDLASSALRVLAFAYRRHDMDLPMETLTDPETIEDDMVFLGLVGMIDPARPEVRDAVRVCAAAGIRPVMITGDYKDTAVAIAKDLGMMDADDRVLAGHELDAMDDDALREAVEHTSVYARVSPDHKVRIVTALRANGHIASMTGDGVNDAMALKSADIGVAMGITGTDVAKGTADMILTDDNFASIVSAVEEGRIIYSNIRKFVGFLLSCNVGEILVIFLTSLILGPGFVPLLPIQLLWLNLVTDSFPALALGSEKGDPDIMSHRPRSKTEAIINGDMIGAIIVQSTAIFLAVYGVFTLSLGRLFLFDAATGASDETVLYARTMAFVTLIFAELLRAFTARSERHSIFRIGWFSNKQMVWAFLASMALLLVVIYVPFLDPVFHTVFLGLKDWGIILVFALVPFAAGEIYKAVRRLLDRKAATA